MPIVKTMNHFNYIECDEQNCNRKIEHPHIKDLFKLADICGWRKTNTQNTEELWYCPKCEIVHRPKQLPRRAKSKSKHATARSL